MYLKYCSQKDSVFSFKPAVIAIQNRWLFLHLLISKFTGLFKKWIISNTLYPSFLFIHISRFGCVTFNSNLFKWKYIITWYYLLRLVYLKIDHFKVSETLAFQTKFSYLITITIKKLSYNQCCRYFNYTLTFFYSLYY